MIRNNCNLLSFINCQEKEWGVICRYFHTSTCSTCSIILFQWICSNLHVSHYFYLFYIQGIELIHISALDIYLVLRSSPVILPTELNDSTVDETVRKISNLCPMVEYLDYLDGFDINKSLCKLMQQLKKEMIYKYIFLLPAAATCFPSPPSTGRSAPRLRRRRLVSENRGDRGQLWPGCRAIASLITISDCVAQYFNTAHNSEEGEEWRLKRRSTQRFVITEKAPTRAFSWLKAPTNAFTFKTLLKLYAKQVLTHSK